MEIKSPTYRCSTQVQKSSHPKRNIYANCKSSMLLITAGKVSNYQNFLKQNVFSFGLTTPETPQWQLITKF